MFLLFRLSPSFFFFIFLNIYDCAVERHIELSHGLLPFPSRLPWRRVPACQVKNVRGGRKKVKEEESVKM